MGCPARIDLRTDVREPSRAASWHPLPLYGEVAVRTTAVLPWDSGRLSHWWYPPV